MSTKYVLTETEKAARWDAYCVRQALAELSLYVPAPEPAELHPPEAVKAAVIAAMERLTRSDLETLMVIADLFADAPPHAMEVTHVAV